MEEINTAQGRLKEIDRILDEYESKTGLTGFQQEYGQSEDFKKYLNLSRDVLEKMHPDECAIAAVILSSAAHHIQRSINRETSRVSWAKAQLKKVVTPRLHNYRGGSFDQIFNMAALDDEYSKKVMDIMDYAQLRVDRLYFIAQSIRAVADDMKNLEKGKRARHG